MSGQTLDFVRQGSNGWADSTRVTSATETSQLRLGPQHVP